MNSFNPHSTSLINLFNSLWRNRNLWWQMTRRDVVGRYRGSIFGLSWSFLNPVIMLTIYTFVFSVVFKARWDIDINDSKMSFAIVLFIGLIVHGFFAECINRAPGLILSNVNLVKKAVFPIEILPFVAIASALFHMAVSTLILILAMLIFSSSLSWTIFFFPMVLVPFLIATAGFSLFLAATGVYVRDIVQITSVITSILLFLAPVFYPISALPKNYHILLHLNPLTFIIEEARKVVIWGRGPDFIGWLIYFTLSLAVLSFGFWWFQRARKGFADVI
jgi:lipopolysaccharide transport system permease protein